MSGNDLLNSPSSICTTTAQIGAVEQGSYFKLWRYPLQNTQWNNQADLSREGTPSQRSSGTKQGF